MKYNENTSTHKVEIGNLIEDKLLEMVEAGKISKEDGYKWVAIDIDGDVFCYTSEPLPCTFSWVYHGFVYGVYKYTPITFTYEQLDYIEKNWKDLLFEIGGVRNA